MAIPNPYERPGANNPASQYGRLNQNRIPGPAGTTSTATVPAPPQTPQITPSQQAAQDWINNPRSGFGGMDSYIRTQNQRWQEAHRTGDTDLVNRLMADAERVGYTLDPYNPPNTTAPQRFADWQAKQNELMAKYEQLLSTPFQYNPETDPAYQAQRQLAARRAEDASQRAMELMNERGVFGSSMMGSQLAQIQQRAEQDALSYIPQYRSEAYGRYLDQLRNAAELLNFAAGRADRSSDIEYRDDRAARSDFETDRAFSAQLAQLEWENMFRQDQFDWQKAQQLWENAFRERNFEEQVRQFAQQMGYNWANLNQREKARLADEAFRNKQFEFQQQQFEYQQEQDELDRLERLSSGGKTAEDYFKFFDDSRFLAPVFDSDGYNRYNTGRVEVVDPEGLERAILSLNLPDSEAQKLYYRYGLRWGN